MRIRKKEQLIINAAKKIFAKKGYDRSKVSDIVKAAKIARGTFYIYYGSKKELFEKLLDELMGRVIANFADIDYSNLNTVDDFYNHIEKVSTRFKDLVLENSDLASIFIKEYNTAGGHFTKRLESYHRGIMETFIEFLNFCRERKIIRNMNPEVVSYSASGIVRELLERTLDSSLATPVDQIIYEGVNLYVYGMIRRE
ncbi:MAG TPA: TetR/AcrR family transcriptional regulator [bacterium]